MFLTQEEILNDEWLPLDISFLWFGLIESDQATNKNPKKSSSKEDEVVYLCVK